MRFAKDSAGHLLAQAFMLPEFYGGTRAYLPPKKRTGRRLTKRIDKPARANFLTALLHVKMCDWDALRAKAAALPLAEKAPRGALRLVLRQERNKRKAARRRVRP